MSLVKLNIGGVNYQTTKESMTKARAERFVLGGGFQFLFRSKEKINVNSRKKIIFKKKENHFFVGSLDNIVFLTNELKDEKFKFHFISFHNNTFSSNTLFITPKFFWERTKITPDILLKAKERIKDGLFLKDALKNIVPVVYTTEFRINKGFLIPKNVENKYKIIGDETLINYTLNEHYYSTCNLKIVELIIYGLYKKRKIMT